jgi:PAS domain S-box-containing protein
MPHAPLAPACLVLDAEGGVTHFTPAAAHLLGVAPEAPPDDALTDAARARLVATARRLTDADARAPVALGPALTGTVHLLGPPGAPTGWLVHLADADAPAEISEGEAREGEADAGAMADAAMARGVAALRSVEERFRRLVEHTGPIIFMLDRQGAFLVSEGRSLAALGLEPGEAVGQSIYDFYGDYPNILAGFEAARDGVAVKTLLKVDDAAFKAWFAPFYDGTGAVAGCIGMSVDVTARKQAEAALRASEARYRLVAESMRDVVILQGLDARITWVSPSVEDVLGYAPDEAVGHDPLTWIHPDDHARMQRRRDAMLGERRPPGPLVVRVRRPDGTYRWLESLSRFLRDDEGRPEAVHSTLRDVTERRQAELALARAARRAQALYALAQALLDAPAARLDDVAAVALDRLATLVPHHRSSVVVYDRDAGTGRIVAARTPGSTDLPAGRTLPLDAFRHVPDADAARTTVYYVADLEAMGDRTPLHDRLEAEGVRSFVSVPFMDGDAVAGTLNLGASAPDGFTREDRTVAQEVAAMLALALRQARYEAGLVAAKERAEEADRLKSAFLANVSHDIRTPLTSIIGFAEVLASELRTVQRAEAETTTWVQFAEMIYQSSERLHQTLDSVLQLSRLQAGSVQLSPEPLDLRDEVRAVQQLLAPRAKAGDVTLTTDLPAHPVAVRCDTAALHRVLINLAGNAVKFTNAGGRVTLGVRPAEAGGGAVVRVADTGIGMSEAFRARMFEAFEQEARFEQEAHDDAGRSRRQGEGSGLGLAIVLRLTELMGGTLDVASTRGEGTTFTLRLPAVPDATPDADPAPAVASDAVASDAVVPGNAGGGAR